MRDLTKSILSFSWVLSLFGVQQTVNLLSPSKAAKAFNHVTEASEQELSGLLKATFNAGDKLQRGALDLTLGLLTGEALNPQRWVRTAADVAQQSADAMAQGVQGAASTLSQAVSVDTQQKPTPTASASGKPSQPGGQGWGPIPS